MPYLRENSESCGICARSRACFLITFHRNNFLCSLIQLTITLALVLEEAKYYKTVGPNINHFDNGPHVVRHPPPSVSLGEDLGLNVTWSCDAVAEGDVAYSWLKNDQVTQFEVITFSFN